VISVTAPTNSQLPQRFGVLAAIVTGPFLHLPEGTISVTYQDWYICPLKRGIWWPFFEPFDDKPPNPGSHDERS
jgi:hypothetical protein